MTPSSVIRDAIARRHASLRYAEAFDHFATEQQTMQAEGREIEATGAAEYARIALRAWEAERLDPEPPEPCS